MLDSSTASRIRDYLEREKSACVDFIRQLVALESPTEKPETQAPVFEVLEQALRRAGFRSTRLPGTSSGGQLYAEPSDRRRGQSTQLLLGHCDTVWPLGTLETMPLLVEDDVLKGPGSFDMKAGLALMVFALKALRHLDLTPSVSPLILISSDEETGSSDSEATIERLARQVERVYVPEPSMGPEGHLKTARKGVGNFTIRVEGKAAHAGLEPEKGVSAIQAMSHFVLDLAKMNNLEKGITVNVGRIQGGLRANVVAPQCVAEVDVRVTNVDDAQRIERAIHSLRPFHHAIVVHVEGSVARPPMERTPRNRKLWRLAQECAGHLAIDLGESMAGGGSDGNITSQFAATLDGLGAIGDGAHARHEFIQISRLPERAALLAMLLLAPPLEQH